MKIFKQIVSLQKEVKSLRTAPCSIGFVPTMGALHNGHLSLIEMSKTQNEYTVVSIFVNPTQFNDNNDFINYPRTIEKDFEKLEEAACDFLFMPDEKEIYPEPDNRIFDLGGLDQIMEGKYRPGHFNGVVQVVTRFFNIVKPDRAYFGYKDFQQLSIIKFIVKASKIPVEIISCPIIRESNGLAMSSRNARLSDSEKETASKISRVLFYLKDNFHDFNSINEIKLYVNNQICDVYKLKLEYFEIVNENSLETVTDIKSKVPKVGCIAVWVGPVRLIDNVKIN